LTRWLKGLLLGQHLVYLHFTLIASSLLPMSAARFMSGPALGMKMKVMLWHWTLFSLLRFIVMFDMGYCIGSIFIMPAISMLEVSFGLLGQLVHQPWY
jgi:hypothetical protein